MKLIYITVDGEYVDIDWLMWEFIKSTKQTQEFILFKKALVKKEIEVFT